MRFLAASALLLAATATPAFAQDEAAPAPFTGPHVEAVAGWDHVGALGDGESGIVYGGAAGYDAQLGHVVLGAEGEATGSSVEDSGVRAGRDLYVGGRIGFVLGDSTMIYAKGGYTNARVRFAGTGTNFDGWRIGGGVEQNFGGRFFGKVEYRYSRYEDADLNRDQVVAGLGVRF